MDHPLSRTSVTVDEAVAILLGWANGPILFTTHNENPSLEEEEILDGLTYSLADALEELQTSPASVKAEAAIDGLSDTELAVKLAEVEQNKKVVQLANTYLCAVNDELNRGEQSELRVDGKLTNEYLTYISLTSLNEWMQGKYEKTILTPAATFIEPVATRPVGRRRMRDQEEAILRTIRKLKYSPESLPHRPAGEAGVKSETLEALATDPLFKAKRAFDKAWERLRADGAIADAPNPPPPKNT